MIIFVITHITYVKGISMVFGFGNKKESAQSVLTAPPEATPAASSSGKISLVKNKPISLEKKNAPIVVRNGWTAKGKDYDLKALVRYHNGRTIYVGAANQDEVLRTPEGAVVHSGDAKRAGELESLTISWHPDIASIAVSSYSALENGRGSFKQYGVYVEIQNGSQVFEISAQDASAKSSSYTLCFGEIVFGENGHMTVTNLEMYSRAKSENRVGYRNGEVVMDIGPEGRNK